MPPRQEPLSSLSTNTIQERKRATAPFATAPARRPAKDAIDSDDEQPSSSRPHSTGPHSGSSLFPPLPLYKEGYEDGGGDSNEADEQSLIHSQLQSQEGAASQGQNERHQQEGREDAEDAEDGDGPHIPQTQQSQPSPYRLGKLWELMTAEELIGATEDEAEDENIPEERPKKRRRRTKAQVAKPKATAATGRSRRGKALGVPNVLEQMKSAMERPQQPDQPTEDVQQQAEEEGEMQEALEGQEAEIQPEPELQQGEIAEEELPDALVEEQQQLPPDEPAVAGDGDGEEGDYEEEEQVEAVDLTAQQTPTPDSPPQQQEVAAPTPSRVSRRLQGREPTTGDDDAENVAENEAENEANDNQPSTQQMARTIQETPQGTGDSVGTNSQQQAGAPDGNGDDGNDADDDVVVVDASTQQLESQDSTKQPVKVALSIDTLNAVVELMSSAGWTGKATWKMSLNWQCMQPGQFGPGPFTEQAKDLLRHLAILADRYVQVPRPHSLLRNENKKYDMRVQREYLRDHEASMEELLRAVDATINIICHEALQPMTTYAVDMTREAARFRWLLADDLIEYAIPKTVELLESVYAMGGSLPLREVGVAAVYLPRNTVQLIHVTWYAARRVTGWIARLENALAWELGYRDYRRMDGDRVVDVEDPNVGNSNNNSNYNGYDDPYPRRAWDNRPTAEAARNSEPASPATKRKDRSRLKPLLNRLEDELGLAWVNLERSRMAQEEEIQAENADEDGDGDGVDADTAAGRPSQRTRQTGQNQPKRKRGRPPKQKAPPRRQRQRQRTESDSESESESEPAPEPTPEPEGTPLEVRRQRAVRTRMADWDSGNDDDQDYVPNSHGDVVVELGQRANARRAEHVDHPETGAYELRVDRVGSSMQILSSQPQWPTHNRYIRIREDGRLDDDDDDIDNAANNINNNDDDDLLMTTAIATAAAAPVSQPSPLVASVEQATQDVVEAVEVEEIEVAEVEVEEEEAAEAEQVADLAADAIEVDADMPAATQPEVPATQAADIPTPEPTPTPTPTPGPAQVDVPATQPDSEPASQPVPQPATQPIPTINTSASPAATPTIPATQGNYTVAEQKLILRRLRALKGKAQLGLISLAAELGRDVIDVARRTEKLKSEVRAQALQANKPVPGWAQAGYTIR